MIYIWNETWVHLKENNIFGNEVTGWNMKL